MNIPDGLLLQFQPFPPRGEILRDLLRAVRGRGITYLYIDPGRQFCWSFDMSLRDPGAYPEEFFRGLLAIGESLDLVLIPVLSSSRIYEFIDAHPGTGASVLPETGPVQISILQHLVEDMAEDLLSVFAFSPCLAILDCEIEAGCGLEKLQIKGDELLKEVSESFGQDVFFIESESCFYSEIENIRPGLSGITIPRSGRYSGFSFPPLPGWLDLLPEEMDSDVRAFVNSYTRTDGLFNDVWRFLRLRWEQRTADFSSVFKKMQDIRNIAPLLKEQGEKLFHSEWFENEQRRWHYALYEAALHQFATRPASGEHLASVFSLLDPVDGGKRYR